MTKKQKRLILIFSPVLLPVLFILCSLATVLIMLALLIAIHWIGGIIAPFSSLVGPKIDVPLWNIIASWIALIIFSIAGTIWALWYHQKMEDRKKEADGIPTVNIHLAEGQRSEEPMPTEEDIKDYMVIIQHVGERYEAHVPDLRKWGPIGSGPTRAAALDSLMNALERLKE